MTPKYTPGISCVKQVQGHILTPLPERKFDKCVFHEHIFLILVTSGKNAI